jgi:predicted secreted protein
VIAGNSDSFVIPVVHWSVIVGSYVIFWFLALFCLLPVGLGEVDPESGAPLSPMLLRKAGIATVIAAVLWVVFFALIVFRILDL